MWPYIRRYADTFVRDEVQNLVKKYVPGFSFEALDIGNIVCSSRSLAYLRNWSSLDLYSTVLLYSTYTHILYDYMIQYKVKCNLTGSYSIANFGTSFRFPSFVSESSYKALFDPCFIARSNMLELNSLHLYQYLLKIELFSTCCYICDEPFRSISVTPCQFELC